MAVLETRELTAFYGDFQALFGITFALNEGETVAIIGANGAGKSTFLKAITGLLPREAASVRLDGRAIGAMRAYEIVKLGIALVPEGRRLFSSLTVEENLLCRRLRPAHRGSVESRCGLSAVPNAARAARHAVDGVVRRTAANGRYRPEPDVESAHPVM